MEWIFAGPYGIRQAAIAFTRDDPNGDKTCVWFIGMSAPGSHLELRGADRQAFWDAIAGASSPPEPPAIPEWGVPLPGIDPDADPF
jgi:hypothetical protein